MENNQMNSGLRKSLRSRRSADILQTLIWFCTVLIFTHSATLPLQADDAEPAGQIDYCLDLHAGENLISFYALPEDASISNVMTSLVGNVTGVTGEGVAATYIDDVGWAGSLTAFEGGKGYWIQTTDAAVLVFNVPEPAGLLLMPLLLCGLVHCRS